VGLARLEAAQRGETLFVVADDSAPVPLLERVNDARRVGATILALDEGDPELDALAHEALAVPESLSFDAGQHLVSAAAGERDATRRRSLRERLANLLDTVSGPNA
jgi:DNA-binding MurR/RpiR family transcriptional regulator